LDIGSTKMHFILKTDLRTKKKTIFKVFDDQKSAETYLNNMTQSTSDGNAYGGTLYGIDFDKEGNAVVEKNVYPTYTNLLFGYQWQKINKERIAMYEVIDGGGWRKYNKLY
jgi:hypothetical protein